MKNKEKINTILFVAFIFSSPYIIFLNNLVVIPQFYKIVSILLIVLLIINNKFLLKSRIFIVLFLITILFFINIFFNSGYDSEILKFYFGFITLGFIPIIFLSYKIDINNFLRWSYYLALINLVLLSISYFYFESIGYMDFGNVGVFSLSFILINILQKKNYFDIFIILGFGVIIFIFGNRSASLALILMIVYLCIVLVKNHILKTLTIVSLAGVSVWLYFSYNNVILYLINVTKTLNINSYSLLKLELALEQGIIAASSGRDDILQSSLILIKSNNYLPVSYSEFQNLTGYAYPHNIFIEFLFNYGFLGGIFFAFLFLGMLFKIGLIKNNKLKHFVALLFIFIMVRLQFSGSYWLETYFWIIVGFVLFYTDKKTSIWKGR